MSTVTAKRTRTETSLSVSRTAPGQLVTVRSSALGGPEYPVIRPVVVQADVRGALVSLVPEGALLLAGDDVHLDIHVGEGVCLTLIEPGGTVAYDMRGGSAGWRVRVRLDEGARLLWYGEPFVVSAGASVRRSLDIALGSRSVLALRETLVLGRHGECGGEFIQETVVTDAGGEPVLVEALHLPAGPAGLILGGHRVVGSMMLLGRGLEAELSCDRLDLEGADQGGVLLRGLGDEAHEVLSESDWQAVVRAASQD